jgi:hypothetical protein
MRRKLTVDEKIRLGGQHVRYNREATAALYEKKLTIAGADECGCTYCKNFAAQRTTIYPTGFLGLLEQLGVDQLKELEAFDYDFGQEKPIALYGGWFVFVGEIVEGKDWRPSTKLTPFSYWFTASFPIGGLPTG